MAGIGELIAFNARKKRVGGSGGGRGGVGGGMAFAAYATEAEAVSICRQARFNFDGRSVLVLQHRGPSASGK